MILAGGVDSAPPRGSQGMKGPWAIGLNKSKIRRLFSLSDYFYLLQELNTKRLSFTYGKFKRK